MEDAVQPQTAYLPGEDWSAYGTAFNTILELTIPHRQSNEWAIAAHAANGCLHRFKRIG